MDNPVTKILKICFKSCFHRFLPVICPSKVKNIKYLLRFKKASLQKFLFKSKMTRSAVRWKESSQFSKAVSEPIRGWECKQSSPHQVLIIADKLIRAKKVKNMKQNKRRWLLGTLIKGYLAKIIVIWVIEKFQYLKILNYTFKRNIFSFTRVSLMIEFSYASCDKYRKNIEL